ncbi:hypothetical protein SNEBB_006711 [Seison nebaliae]|nr:hypothetical protein SNEBB_006711 [Seison nebaliae]
MTTAEEWRKSYYERKFHVVDECQSRKKYQNFFKEYRRKEKAEEKSERIAENLERQRKNLKISKQSKFEENDDDDGWTIVGEDRRKRRNNMIKNFDDSYTVSTYLNTNNYESRGDKARKKKQKEKDQIFLLPQLSQTKKQRLNNLQNRFDEDKKTIEKMKESRKFRPLS